MAESLIRSKLFVPASRPELVPKALASAADAVSIDLEDAVPAHYKNWARQAIAGYLQQARKAAPDKTMIVRVNPLRSAHFEADIQAIVQHGLHIVNLPKVETKADIHAAAKLLAKYEKQRRIEIPIAILANIESPKGLRWASDIASAHPRICGLQLGFADLFEPLGIERLDPLAVYQVRFNVRMAAGEAGIAAYDGAFSAIRDLDGFRSEAEMARRLGFTGKSCIHPGQIAIANEVFSPSHEQIAHALRVMDAALEPARTGAFVVDDRMIDEPFLRRAKAVVDMAQRLGLLPV